jgi:hypothetical protein
MIFGKHGNLWVSKVLGGTNGSIAEFSAADLGALGNPGRVMFLNSDASGSNMLMPALVAFGCDSN